MEQSKVGEAVMAYNILLVDDSATVRAIISKTLTMAGVETGQIFEAANGQEALELLGREWVDLVFADINMPVMGGVEMIEKMYQDGPAPDGAGGDRIDRGEQDPDR